MRIHEKQSQPVSVDGLARRVCMYPQRLLYTKRRHMRPSELVHPVIAHSAEAAAAALYASSSFLLDDGPLLLCIVVNSEWVLCFLDSC